MMAFVILLIHPFRVSWVDQNDQTVISLLRFVNNLLCELIVHKVYDLSS